MPTLHLFEGIKVEVYSRDHLPPHIHLRYGGDEALLEIQSGAILAGHLPVLVLRKCRKWMKEDGRTAWLLQNFYELNPGLKK